MLVESENQKVRIDAAIRHAEYYDLQECFDTLYAKAMKRESFSDLMTLIESRENILLAYRNVKANKGSKTPGVDGLVFKDIGQMTENEVVEKVRNILGGKHGYRPKPVRRVEIPKAGQPDVTRPLGIPCVWDRLIQQCILQVMEPICEAQFSNNSYGFRPGRGAENAIAALNKMMQFSNLHQVIEFDIKGFFDNVDHSKLIRQIWALGIRDKRLIYIIKQILKAPIKMPNGSMITPRKGTPQGGILSPLLANIVLNELDHWVDSQWQSFPQFESVKEMYDKDGYPIRSHQYRAARSGTSLKEIYIVRYADDIRVACRTRSQAVRAKMAITMWLKERLRLDVSPEKTRIVNTKKHSASFLGFEFKLKMHKGKHVVTSHISSKAKARIIKSLKQQINKVKHPKDGRVIQDEINLYNLMVNGMHNYYRLAGDCVKDFGDIAYVVNKSWKSAFKLNKTADWHPESQMWRHYSESKQLRFIGRYPIAPISYCQHKTALGLKRGLTPYTERGRKLMHKELQTVDVHLMHALMRQPAYGRSLEYIDNRISLFSAQQGRCAVTGWPFLTTDEIHCHHKTPKALGGKDNYGNLMLVHEAIHKIIHTVNTNLFQSMCKALNLSNKQITRVKELREMAQTTSTMD